MSVQVKERAYSKPNQRIGVMTLQEVSERLNMKPSTVRYHHDRALAKIRKALIENHPELCEEMGYESDSEN